MIKTFNVTSMCEFKITYEEMEKDINRQVDEFMISLIRDNNNKRKAFTFLIGKPKRLCNIIENNVSVECTVEYRVVEYYRSEVSIND